MMSRTHKENPHALHLAHHHPGRVRLRSKAFEGENTAGPALAALRSRPGIEYVEHGPITGSVLIHYTPGQIGADEIVARVADASGLCVSNEKVPDPADLTHLIIDKGRDLNALVAKVTGYHTDVRGIVPIALAGLAGYSLITQKGRLPNWDNLAYWAFSIFTELHREELATPRAQSKEVAPAGALAEAR
jgi:hypothetical protein